MNRKPEPTVSALIASWARIYKAILEANEREMELSLQAHIELYPNDLQSVADQWSEIVFLKALGLSREELESRYQRCVRFRVLPR